MDNKGQESSHLSSRLSGHLMLISVAANVRHTIASDYRSAICIVIEPESVRAGAFDEWERRLSGGERAFFAHRIRSAYEQLGSPTCRADLSSAEFDHMCFGEALPRRMLDPRVVRSIAQMTRFSGEAVTAASCAAEVGLSASRFLHLFKEETGISFRSFRAWKRDLAIYRSGQVPGEAAPP